jgi:hypothetical protein
MDFFPELRPQKVEVSGAEFPAWFHVTDRLKYGQNAWMIGKSQKNIIFWSMHYSFIFNRYCIWIMTIFTSKHTTLKKNNKPYSWTILRCKCFNWVNIKHQCRQYKIKLEFQARKAPLFVAGKFL